MLEKNYSSIYEMDSYKKISKTWPNKDAYRDISYALANMVYTASKQCITVSSDDPLNADVIVNELNDPLITYILSYDPSTLETLYSLKDAGEKKNNKMTMLDAAIMVCETYNERNKKR